MCQAAQPLAAIAAERYALGAEMACSAWGLGACARGCTPLERGVMTVMTI